MIAIAVDDEILMLGALVSAIKASPDISEVSQFSDCDEALDFVKENTVDVAFLDINMRGMGGLVLAEKIISFCPECKIVFCTGYEEYAIPAFKLHASGYLMKPVSAKDIQVEIDNIKAPVKVGDVVGKINVLEDGKNIMEVDITVMENINKANIFKVYYRNLLDIMKGTI